MMSERVYSRGVIPVEKVHLTVSAPGAVLRSQEALKLLACLCMLIDHIGAVLVPLRILRVIGRLAFPIYCFLLTEGAIHTRSPFRYGLRLAVGMLLSEIPFDLLFYGKLTFEHQSVMVTLLLGFLGTQFYKSLPVRWLRPVVWLPLAAAADLLHTDYGGYGVILIAVFTMLPGRNWLVIRVLLMTALFFLMNSANVHVFGLSVPIQIFAILALIPMELYNGKKAGSGKTIQWIFYLFYPAHMLVLLLLK